MREFNSSAAAAAVANNTGAAVVMMLEGATILSYTGFSLGGLMLFVWSGMWFVHLIAIVYGKYRLYRHGVKSGDDIAASMQRVWPELGGRPPCISIIKPLVGIESNMLINLESFFLLNYPHECYELLFCISEPQDPALMIVNTLVEKYPDVDATVFVGGINVGVNPKINNMMPAYNAAKYPLIVVSDAGIYMRPNTLNNMALTMDARAGVVHQMPYTVDRCELGFPACLEKTFFGTAHARIYLAADVLGISCCTGMSCLYRKCVLDECGGFAAFGKHLAEDFFFAKAFTDRKWKLRLCTEPAWQNSSVCTVSYFKNRLQRWQRLRFAMLPHTMFCEPLQENSFIGLMAALSASLMFGISFWGFWIGHTLLWFVLDWLLLNVVQNGAVPYSKLEYTLAWLTREYMAPFLYFGAVLQPHIRWKKSVYKLKWGGEAILMPSKSDSNDLTSSTAAAAAAAAAAKSCAVVIDAEFDDDDALVAGGKKKMPTSVSDYEDDGESDNNNNFAASDDDDDDDNKNSNRKTGDEEELLQTGSAAAPPLATDTTGGSSRRGSTGRKQPPQRNSSLLYQRAAGRMLMLKNVGNHHCLYDHTRFKNDDDDDDKFDAASDGKYRALKTPTRTSPPPPPPPPLPSTKHRRGHLQRNLNVVASLQQQQQYSSNGKLQKSTADCTAISIASSYPSSSSSAAARSLRPSSPPPPPIYAENHNMVDDNNNLLLIMPPRPSSSQQQQRRNSNGSSIKPNKNDVVVVVGRPRAASRMNSTSSSTSSSASATSSSSSSCSLVSSNRQSKTT